MREFEIDNFPSIGGVICSKMIVEEHYKPLFIFREKPFNENDSGWRLFSGFESDEYSDNSDNFGIYDPKTILKIDNSISTLLLYKGIGTVWEREPDNEWKEVFDYPLQDDFTVENQLTDNWKLSINNLFIKNKDQDGVMFTTNDKTLRLDIWTYIGKTKEEIVMEKKEAISERNADNEIIKKYQFDQGNQIKIGYHIKEYSQQKDIEYNLICGFCIVDYEVLNAFFYFDNENDVEWALNTWKMIEYN
ncbi:DUF2185 domain-containing protein [Zobellia galactanivorans]|uniref:Immunity protein Imm33 domain-containing protein n=1 Tax=Zobellia galactanivorans (strain DSM 12802 / CCUG 47099 / CIP 106680 / NCIMB 13871 / Dsij) TaxID=63186 RepID=G0L401_ZOBGA|nr:DUF2185 domain-containing protein [Zobellia galactanivorans]CAZ98552.1 Conserved hypothetical protein [Zobellia galactanivorans]